MHTSNFFFSFQIWSVFGGSEVDVHGSSRVRFDQSGCVGIRGSFVVG